MTRAELQIYLTVLEGAYPYAWPKGQAKETIFEVWFDQFNQLSWELFAEAVRNCIGSVERISIAAMWTEILSLSGVPTVQQVEEAVAQRVDYWHSRDREKGFSYPL
ncbi:MAG: replicative helicase loader/inhibitor, partial [Candidatus Mariimomonas ferrooxydans]